MSDLKQSELSLKIQIFTTRMIMMQLEDTRRLQSGQPLMYGKGCFEELIEEQEALLGEIQELQNQEVVQQAKATRKSDSWITDGWVDELPTHLTGAERIKYKMRNGDEYEADADCLNWAECGYATIVGYKIVDYVGIGDSK